MLLLALAAAFFINRLSGGAESRFLLAVFLSGLGVRVIITVLTMLFSLFKGNILNYSLSFLGAPDYSAPDIIGDSAFYTLRSQFISMFWLGRPLDQSTLQGIFAPYGYTGFMYILAVFFTLFGYSPISSRFINCLMGSLLIVLVYSIVKDISNQRAARLAAVLTAFFPSLLLWSTTNLKEPSTIFVVYLMLWSLVRFQKTRSPRYLTIAALSIAAQASIRYSYKLGFVLLTVGLIALYLFYAYLLDISLRRRAAVFLLVFIIGGGALFSQGARIKSAAQGMVQTAYVHHKGVINTGGICYRLLPDDFYADYKNVSLIAFVRMLGRGWFHILFEPLPQRAKESASMLFSLPQMLLWYLLIPFAVLGAAILIRYRLKESTLLAAYFILMTSALAVFGGNIGTMFRIRDITTPLVLIFASVGLFNAFSCLAAAGSPGRAGSG